MNHLERSSIDAALHLLDRQVVDRDGLMVCKVDDLEVSDPGDGSLAVTGILTGGAALFPRLSHHLGGWLATTWHRLGQQKGHRDTPDHLPLGLVTELGSGVRIRVSSEGLLDRQPSAGEGTVHRRVTELLGMSVRGPGGARLGNVLDLRLEPGGESWRIHEVVVGRGRPGSLLGYDRGEVHGPALLAWAVRRLHRHTGQLPWSAVSWIDWRDGTLTVDRELDELEGS